MSMRVTANNDILCGKPGPGLEKTEIWYTYLNKSMVLQSFPIDNLISVS